jgi:demethylmenaquinone methyltransferase / 2-methoxy-6-polyprenyl-1,4-benzoquinol methylase
VTALVKTPGSAADGSGQMFDAIAGRYDLVNRVISFGNDRRWRRRTVDALELAPGQRVLDLATGTGDLAILIARRHRDATVVGVDPSAGMLAVAEHKVRAARLAGRIVLRAGDAQALDHPDASFDAACMAFGIRNVPDRPRALAELGRVVRPGGRIAILELGEPRHRAVRFHVHRVIPWIGALLSRRRAYLYLERSIARFPAPDEFAAMMTAAGLEMIETRRLTFGTCWLFVARATGRRPA